MFYSCVKDNNYFFNEDELEYIDFAPESYWIYNVFQNGILSQEQDSVIVVRRSTSQWCDTGRPTNCFDVLEIAVKYNDEYFHGDYFTSVGYHFSDLPYAKVLQINTELADKLDQYAVGNQTYLDVIRLSNYDNTEIIYFAKNVGVIYASNISTGYSWELVKANLFKPYDYPYIKDE